MNQKLKNITTIIGAFSSVFLLSFFVFAWSEPTSSPPGGDFPKLKFIGGNIGFGTNEPQEKVDVVGDIKAERIAAPRALRWVTGHHHDTTCDVSSACGPSPLSARTLTFTKTKNDTAIRVFYIDNMRSYSADGTHRACQWHIYFNGSPCPSIPIRGAVYSEVGAGQNIHRTRSIGGVCTGQPAGTYTIQVYVSNAPGYQARCYTGWNSSFYLEAEEVFSL